LFLKYCGENKFSVPVYFTERQATTDPDCIAPGPNYRVACIPFVRDQEDLCDTLLLKNKFTIISILDTTGVEAWNIHAEKIRRVLSDIDSPEILQALTIYIERETDAGDSLVVTGNNLMTFGGNLEEVSHFARCVLFLPDKNKMFSYWVLTDNTGRIRGFYESWKFEEVERLILEIKILLNEYQKDEK
jgi:hypothetical protein